MSCGGDAAKARLQLGGDRGLRASRRARTPSLPGCPVPAGQLACARCLARSWLLVRLAANLERVRSRILSVLSLDEEELIVAVAGESVGRVRSELAQFDPAQARERDQAAGVAAVCRHHQAYPAALRTLAAPPAVIYIAGDTARLQRMAARQPVAVVGSRSASCYGLQVSRSLARGLSGAGIPVISGMALGVDSAAHTGALEGRAGTIAVLPAGPDRVYPASKRGLSERIHATGATISELPPGARVWKWTFPARNRIIAGLAAMTIVVEADARSGALITARLAGELGRPVGAIPGRVTSSKAAGPNGLLAAGAHLITGAQDALDVLFGAGARRAKAREREELAPALRSLLEEIAAGHDTATALERAGVGPEQGLAALAALELAGHVLREPGGRFSLNA